jgi:TonB family protein
MKALQIFASCAVLLITVSSPAADNDESYRQHIVNAPAPEYPIEARARRWTGQCMVLVDVDTHTGYVVGARILKSTGHAVLDHVAISTFSRWRFQPGTVKHVRIPVNFALR